MIKATRELRGLLLIVIHNGSKLGEIKDFYLDADARHITAVLYRTEGLLNRRYLVVPQAQVQVMGVDAWLLAGEDPAVELGELDSEQNMSAVSDIIGREVATEGGTRIGRIGDVIVDAQAKVLGFALDKVYVQGPLAERQRIVRDTITNLGGKDAPLIVDLSKAEATDLNV